MAISTYTLQMTQDPAPPLTLHLQGGTQTPEAALKKVLGAMKQVCNDEMQQFLEVWEDKFFTQYKSLATDQEKMEFALSLAELYFKSDQSPLMQNFCNSIKQSLIEIAPVGCNIDLFLEGYTLRVLLLDMKSATVTLSSPFKEGMVELFTAWEQDFFQQFKGSAATQKEKVDAAKHLCALYCRAEGVMLSFHENDLAQIPWLKICSRLKRHLLETLPSRLPVDKFLAQYMKINKILEMKRLFQNLENELYGQANSINEEFIAGFNEIKGDMIDVQDAVTLSSQETYERLDALTRRVTKLFSDFDKDGMQAIADLLGSHGQALSRTLNAANRVLDKV